jgi:hypothetical protein
VDESVRTFGQVVSEAPIVGADGDRRQVRSIPMHSSSRGAIGLKTVVAALLAVVLVGGGIAIAVRAGDGGSSAAGGNPTTSPGSSNMPGKHGHKHRHGSQAPVATTPPAVIPSGNATRPASQQSCAQRLGPSAGKLPKSLPKPAKTTFDGIDNDNGLYAGHVAGADAATEASTVKTDFTNAGYTTSGIITQGTVSKFAFKLHKLKGVAYIAVLCTGNLRVEYQLVHPLGHHSPPPSPSTEPTTTPKSSNS